MASDKIVFEQKHVFIQDRQPQTESKASSYDEITGTIALIENSRGIFIRFVPFGLEDAGTDDWALISGGHSIISYKNHGNDKDSITVSANSLLKHRHIVNINTLQSVRRQRFANGVNHVIFTLKDKTTLPAFYFNIGGSREFLIAIGKYLNLEKSSQDHQLYIIRDELIEEENSREPVSVFDQMNLFDESSNPIQRIRGRHHPRRRGLERFAKVAHFFKDAFLGEGDFINSNENQNISMGADVNALMQSFSKDLREANNDGFAVIYKVDFEKLPEVTRAQGLTTKEWQSFFNKDGRITDVAKLKERIFRGGLESNVLRREVWKFLLNYYPWTSTHEERLELEKKKESEYFAMKLQWKSMNDQQKQKNSLFRERESLIDKDVIRTDRTHEYFEGDNNIHLEVLRDILMTYNMYNFDLGYVQGMNDLLSPILIVMENEVDAFWCFVGLMERMEQNFHMDQSHIRRQLSNLHTLLQFVDTELANYLAENNSSNMYFFFRWMLICFKREFSFDDIMRLWEVLWTDHLCCNFELLVCLAILISQKAVIMESKFGCNEILKHINDLSLKVPLEPLLQHAEGFYILLKQHDQSTPGLPSSISSIMFPSKRKHLKNSNEDNGQVSDSEVASSVSSVKSSRESSPNRKPERKARTRQLTESHTIDENDSAVVSHSNNN